MREEIISVIAVQGTMLASTRAGLFRSTDGGSSWIYTSRGSADRPIYNLWSDGPVLHAQTADRPLRSLDSGAAWIGTSGAVYPWILKATASSDSIAVALDYRDRLLTTTDHGATWGGSGGPPGQTTTSIVMDGANWYAATFGNGVYRTSDRGRTWTQLLDGLPKDALPPYAIVTRLIDDGDDIIAAFPGTGLLLLDKADGRWRLPEVPHPGRDVTHLVRWRGGIVAVDEDGLWFREDDEWNALGPAPRKDLQALVVDGDNLIALCGASLFRSGDGRTWTSLVRRLRDTRTRIVAGAPGVLVAAGDYGVRRSLDNGRTWTSIDGLEDRRITSVVAGTSRVLIGTDNGMYELPSSERRPTRIDSLPAMVRAPEHCPMEVTVSRPDHRLFATLQNSTCARQGTLVSDDGGVHWREPQQREWEAGELFSMIDAGGDSIAAALPRSCNALTHRMEFQYVTRYAVARCSKGVFLAPARRGLHRLADSLGRLTPLNAALPGMDIVTMMGSGDALLASFEGLTGLYSSADGGAHWSVMGLAQQEVLVLARIEGALYAGTNDGVWRSRDAGLTWTQLTGPANGAVR